MTNCCKVCKKEAALNCSGCLSVVYCSKKCQVVHWREGHKSDCKPFEVKRNEKLGRYMVAKRDLKAGQVLFREFAVVHGPKMLSHPICLGCHGSLSVEENKPFYTCSSCNWPLCGKSCEKLDPHVEECKLMKSKGYKCPTMCPKMHSNAIYCLIFPLRFLLLKRTDTKLFEKILSELESHVDERISSGSYDALQTHLVPFVQKILNPKDFPEKLILTAAAILDNNCFEVSMPMRGVDMGGLFLLSLILCNDCVPNTKHYVNFIQSNVDIQRYQMTFQTTVPVKKGEQLTTTYTNTLHTTLQRRFHLRQTKIFDCDCPRCQDPLELSTNFSSLLCRKCGTAVVSKNSLDKTSDWGCSKCGMKLSCKDVTSRLTTLQHQLENLNKRSPERIESFISNQSEQLHSNHCLMIEAKYALSILYGNVAGYTFKELPPKLLKRKIELCENVLNVYDKIHPGETTNRSNVLFELSYANILRTKKDLNDRKISREDAQLNIGKHFEVAKQCFSILVQETENKMIMERRLACMAKECVI